MIADTGIVHADEGVPHPELLLAEDVLDAAHRAAGNLTLGAVADDRLPVMARSSRRCTIAFTSSRRASRERLSL